MITASSMQNSLTKAQVTYLKFALHVKNGKDGLYCFFEGLKGSDNTYYIPRIKAFTEIYHCFNCGGREKVLAVFSLINAHSEYDKYKKAYFVDRDFNWLVTLDQKIYETPCYSIENLYVTSDTFQEILKNVLQISEVDPDFNLALNLFESRINEFHFASELINAWYCCLIDIRNRDGIPTGVNLENSLPKGLVTIGLNSVTSDYNLEKLENLFPHSSKIDTAVLQNKIQAFRDMDQSQAFRGKYELSFMLKFIELLIINSNSEQTMFTNKLKPIFGPHLNNDQALVVFSSYAKTPQSLNIYLSTVTIK